MTLQISMDYTAGLLKSRDLQTDSIRKLLPELIARVEYITRVLDNTLDLAPPVPPQTAWALREPVRWTFDDAALAAARQALSDAFNGDVLAVETQILHIDPIES